MHNKDFESGLCKEALREGVEYSDGRDVQNMWKKLDVFYSMWFISAFKFACFKLCNVFTGLFELFFVEYHVGVLNLWAGATQCHWRYHPNSNWGETLGCRNIWPEPVAALPLLTRKCKCRTAMCVVTNDKKNEYKYIAVWQERHMVHRDISCTQFNP